MWIPSAFRISSFKWLRRHGSRVQRMRFAGTQVTSQRGPATLSISRLLQKPATGLRAPSASAAAQNIGNKAAIPPNFASRCETTCSQDDCLGNSGGCIAGEGQSADKTKYLLSPITWRISGNQLFGAPARECALLRAPLINPPKKIR